MARPPVSSRALAAARGDEPADLLLRGGRVFAPATREWVATDLAIADGVVVGWGAREARETLDVDGAALTAGFIDAHMHLESTKLWIDRFVRGVLPWGTTAVACDPHEIANVLGMPGVLALIDAAADMPFTFGVAASSCVPASKFESSAAAFTATDVRRLIEQHGAIGVAEVMNFPGVIGGDPAIREIIAAAGWRRVDGHAPGLTGRALDAYLAAGVESDHESAELAEAHEKRQKSMWVFLRHGSASQDLVTLLPSVLQHGSACTAFCTDDREPDVLRRHGHVNYCAQLAVAAGLSESDALLMATFHPATYHNFFHLGSLGPGFQADVCVFDELGSWKPAMVFQKGALVARAGHVVEHVVPHSAPPAMYFDSMHLHHLPSPAELDLADPPSGRARVIGVLPRSIRTTSRIVDLRDPANDVARIAVLERHAASGRIGLGFVSGFGLHSGAIASTVAHDAHNVMVVGARDGGGPADMAVAVARLAELGGGQVVVAQGRVVAELALPLGGLMSDRPLDEVADGLEAVVHAAAAIGVTLPAPFMALSFLGLSVLPDLRITDRGLVDVNAFTTTSVAVP
ncbi:MAG: adenine deaminase C-terminal domain-containing protein [Ilumatobacteraceae bacterium]